MQANGSSLLITLNSALKSQYVLFHPQKTKHGSSCFTSKWGRLTTPIFHLQSMHRTDKACRNRKPVSTRARYFRKNKWKLVACKFDQVKYITGLQQQCNLKAKWCCSNNNWTIPTVYILPYTLSESTSMPLLFLFPNVCTLVCAHNDIALFSETLSKMRPKPKECVTLHGPN